ncbi:hypothetical protein BS50DRAFT_62076 [Corynespora cassiicola Philippines]|uniref:Uncharacterized protein n=1 Tax=Corynespora cassiicola Philippines TaxID=1448308 RepID=A0A2T2NJG0_CORCC|nr:hypothetical protein BS50DRAFT_62076 [Corynespora cassiicola Philippines]
MTSGVERGSRHRADGEAGSAGTTPFASRNGWTLPARGSHIITLTSSRRNAHKNFDILCRWGPLTACYRSRWPTQASDRPITSLRGLAVLWALDAAASREAARLTTGGPARRFLFEHPGAFVAWRVWQKAAATRPIQDLATTVIVIDFRTIRC